MSLIRFDILFNAVFSVCGDMKNRWGGGGLSCFANSAGEHVRGQKQG